MDRSRRSSPFQRWLGLGILLVLPLLVSCSGPTAPSTELQDENPGTGALTGSVSRGAMTSIEVPGATSSIPVAGAKVIVSRSGGGEVGSATTDAGGAYRVPLMSGTYLVTLTGGPSHLFTKDLPATITVVDGQTTTLNVTLDTGIR